MERVKKIVNNKTCAVMLHGKSIEELENRIDEFRGYNMVWTSLSQFTVMQDFILDKINQELSIVLDCSSVANDKIRAFEYNIRKPRLERLLRKPFYNLWVTTNGIINLYRNVLNENDFMNKFSSKIFAVDNIFPKQKISHYMDVPHSANLLIALLIAGGAKKIILFGFDGYNGSIEEGIKSYYKSDLALQERLIALGTHRDDGINYGTRMFEERFPNLHINYIKLFNNSPKILNCSPNSLYTVLPKVDYNEVKKWLN